MKYKREILYGLAGGVSVIIFSLVMYSIDEKMFVSSLVFWVGTLILILFMALAMLHARSGISQAMGFKPLLRTGFLVYIVGNLICYAFLYVMFNSVNPELEEIQREQIVNFLVDSRGFDVDSPEVINARDGDYSMSVGTTIYGYVRGLIFGFLVAALMAYVLKEKPYFYERGNNG